MLDIYLPSIQVFLPTHLVGLINSPHPINPYQPHPSTFPKDAFALASNVSFGDKDLDQYQVAVGPLGSLG